MLIEKFSTKGFNYPKAKFFPVPMEFTQKQGLVVPESKKSITTPVFDLISQLQRVLQDPDATKKIRSSMMTIRIVHMFQTSTSKIYKMEKYFGKQWRNIEMIQIPSWLVLSVIWTKHMQQGMEDIHRSLL